MPLIKSGSKKSIGENMKREMDAGKPKRQALAIALEVQRRNRKKMAQGGEVENEDLNPQHEPGMGPQTSITRDSIDDRQAIEPMMSAEPAMEDMPHGMLGMDAEEIAMALRHKMADGGPVLDSNKTVIAQDSLRKAFHYADGGEVEGLADDHMNSGFMEDDFLSQDSNPMPEDLSRSSNELQAEDPDDQRKRRLSSIMSDLHARHYGKK